MGRGKPFVQSLRRLGPSGLGRQAPWQAAVAAATPEFEAVRVTKPGRITYPEDRLRSIYLQRHAGARRVAVDLKAKTVAERHVADRFVGWQMRLMEDGMSEEEAYSAVERRMKKERGEAAGVEGPLVDADLEDDGARLYLASVGDSRRDRELYRALVEQEVRKG